MRIAFRADASLEIGSGHVMRCLTLADALGSSGCRVRFLCRHLPAFLADEIRRRGHELALLPAPDTIPFQPSPQDTVHAAWLGVAQDRDAHDTLDALEDGETWDWLVVDHYALDSRWESKLRRRVDRILALDDLADRHHDCDLLLDQNLYADMDTRYDRKVPSRCVRLLGPRYALLRPEFRALRDRLAPRDGAVRRLLVFFGGMDAHNVTGVALEAISRLDRGAMETDVVIGSGHPDRRHIEASCRKSGMRCHVQTPDMASLMAAADLALGAGGTATWERCALGLPTLVLCLAGNQKALIHDASRAGLIYAPDLDPFDGEGLSLHLRALISNPSLRNLLSRNGMNSVDGLGALRVAQVLVASNIEVRRATEADSAAIHAWRNDLSIRKVSRNPDLISSEAHARWFASVLANPDCCLLMGSQAGEPVGVVRFDLDRHAAEVSIYLVPGRAGRGEGRSLLLAAERWLRANRSDITTLRAQVLHDNMPSHRLFVDCGYARQTTDYSKEIQ